MRPAHCLMSFIEPEAWLNLSFGSGAHALSPCHQGEGLVQPQSHWCCMSIWLCWLLCLVFSNLTASPSYASSISLPRTLLSDLASLLPPAPATRSILGSLKSTLLWFLLPSESLLDKSVTLEDFVWFCLICCMALTYTVYPITDVAKFIPCGKKCKPYHQGHKPMSFPNCNENISAS